MQSADQLQGESVEDLRLIGVTEHAAVRILQVIPLEEQETLHSSKSIPADPPGTIGDDDDDNGEATILLIPMPDVSAEHGLKSE